MSITWTNVVNVDASLANVSTAAQTQILASVDRQIDDDAWGDLADDGRTYLAAHMGTLYLRGGAAGPVIGETLGPMSVNYALVQGMKGPFSTTGSGIFLLHLISLLPSSVGFVP